jgi:hypothetical protein
MTAWAAANALKAAFRSFSVLKAAFKACVDHPRMAHLERDHP